MTSGTRSKTGAKTGKAVDPDNGAKSAFPKKASETEKAKRAEAGRKAAETRRRNKALKDALGKTKDSVQVALSTSSGANLTVEPIVAATKDMHWQVGSLPPNHLGAYS